MLFVYKRRNNFADVTERKIKKPLFFENITAFLFCEQVIYGLHQSLGVLPF
jgi:hypothetical protein